MSKVIDLGRMLSPPSIDGLMGEILPPYFKIPEVRQYNASPIMRGFGYTKNPDTCIHHRKMYYGGSWSCKDCGESL